MKSGPHTRAILFTDIEGSTKRWERDPVEMDRLTAEHDRLLTSVITDQGGQVVKTMGDGILAVFPDADGAIRSAIEAQRRLWPDPPHGLGLPVRMAVHHGAVTARDGDVFGPEVIRCSRLMNAAHGGQVLVSGAAASSSRSSGMSLLDLGEHYLRDLSDPIHIHQVEVDGLPVEFPPLGTLTKFAHNLPTRLTTFVGREQELADLAVVFEAHRLVTLCGPGGSGKTRLALQAAADSLEEGRDGTWFVNLLTAAPGDDVAATVAAELDIEISDDPAQAVAKALAATDCLLVLDNCEHVLDSSAQFVRHFLRSGDSARVLTTSREPLHVAGEFAYAVGPLANPLDDGQPSSVSLSPAVQLFVDRMTDVGAQPMTDLDIAAIGELCRRLDGLPLAIELAAARTRFMSLGELSAALTQSFDVLRSKSEEDQRHQTIRSTVEWSYQLLREDDRLLLDRLSVFRDGWFRDEAAWVCGEAPLTPDSVQIGLDELIDKSLVQARRTDSGSTRMRLLEQIRQFADERLDQAAEATLGQRLIDYYIEVLEGRGRRMTSPPTGVPREETDALVVRLTMDLANLIAAIETALESDRTKDALGLLANGAWEAFFIQSGYAHRYLSWLDRGLPDVSDPQVAVGALLGAGAVFSATTEPSRMVELGQEALSRAREHGLEYAELNALLTLGQGLHRTGQAGKAKLRFREVAERAGDRYPDLWQEARLCHALFHCTSIDEYEAAIRILEVGSAERSFPSPFVSIYDFYVALVALDLVRPADALAACDRALAEPYNREIAVLRCHINDLKARALAQLGRQGEAEIALEHALEAARRVIGPNWAVTMAWEGAAVVAEYANDPERAQSSLTTALEKAEAGDIQVHRAQFALFLVPYALDRGDVVGAEARLNEAKSALKSVERFDGVLQQSAELMGALIASARGEPAGAAELALRRLEGIDSVELTMKPPVFELELAAGIIWSLDHSCAHAIYRSIDEWLGAAGIAGNPVVRGRRPAEAQSIAGDESSQPLDPEGALELAVRKLKQMA